MPVLKIVTIGVYGFDQEGFFQAIREADVDTFCDIRRRRGLRGPQYSFANSRALQARLAEMNINYIHRPDLAPSKELREQQRTLDKATRTLKRSRVALGEVFCDGYQQECLDNLDSQQLLSKLGQEVRVVALFCVEREPAACHRSLLAAYLQRDLDIEVEHITP